ncbi:MAG: DegV family protein [Bacillota bacterium]
MQKVAIVTDSTADLPRGTYEEHGIVVVPLLVHFGDEIYRDGVDLSSDEFYDKLVSSKILPRTSQPSPHDFQVVYGDLASKSEEIVSIHLSSKLSGTYQSATIAAGMMKDTKVRVIDGKGASAATGLLVLEAARLAGSGATADDIVARIDHLIEGMVVFFTVDTLEYLEKNGRIGKATAFLGTLLSIRPLLQLYDGEVTPFEKVRGSKAKVLARMIAAAKERAPSGKRLRAAIMHGAVPEEAAALRQTVERELACDEILTACLGPVIGSHAGPGTLGLAFYPVD